MELMGTHLPLNLMQIPARLIVREFPSFVLSRWHNLSPSSVKSLIPAISMVLVIMEKTSEAQKSCTLSMRLHTVMEFIKFILQFLRRLNSLCGSRGQNKDRWQNLSGGKLGSQGEKQFLMGRAGQHGVSPRRPEVRPAGSKPRVAPVGHSEEQGPWSSLGPSSRPHFPGV